MGSEESGLITGGYLFHNLKDSAIDLSKVFVIQRALVVRCNARKDLFLAFRVIQTHVGIGLKGSDIQGMTGSLIQKSDELLIDCVDLRISSNASFFSDISYSFHEKTVSAPYRRC